VVNADRSVSTPESAAMLAHELRRRLAALRVVGEAITTLRGRGMDTAAMLELLVGEIDALDELAREMLWDGPRGEPTDADADTAAVVRVAARTVATARGVTIGVDAPPVPVVVQASATTLRQAIENLLDNAARHGGVDGVEVGVRPDPDRGEVDVVVVDRGLRAGREDTAGHGIGLLLVRRFLDDTGGRSWMTERPGGGTVVGLSLPLRPVEEGHLEDAVNT
jgi:two-component system, OmpR family, sensor histidine kinase TctE